MLATRGSVEVETMDRWRSRVTLTLGLGGEEIHHHPSLEVI